MTTMADTLSPGRSSYISPSPIRRKVVTASGSVSPKKRSKRSISRKGDRHIEKESDGRRRSLANGESEDAEEFSGKTSMINSLETATMPRITISKTAPINVEEMRTQLEEDLKQKEECDALRAKLRIQLQLLENEAAERDTRINDLQWYCLTLDGVGDGKNIRLGVQQCLDSVVPLWSNTQFPEIGQGLNRLQETVIKMCATMHGKSSDIFNSMQMLLQTVSKIQENALKVAICAPLFDLRPGLPWNGYRSMMRVLNVCVEKARKQIKQGKVDDRQAGNSVHVYLDTIGELFSMCCTMLDNSSPAYLFPVAACDAIVPKLQREMPLEVFYGAFFGLHFKKGLRRVLGALLIAMTSFGDSFERGDMYDKLKALMISPKYISSQNRAAKKVVDLFCGGDLQFLKSFWNLQETVIFVEIDTAVRTPSPSVNTVLTIPVHPIVYYQPSGNSAVVADRLMSNVPLDERPYDALALGEEMVLLYQSVFLTMRVWKHPTTEDPSLIIQVSKHITKRLKGHPKTEKRTLPRTRDEKETQSSVTMPRREKAEENANGRGKKTRSSPTHDSQSVHLSSGAAATATSSTYPTFPSSATSLPILDESPRQLGGDGSTGEEVLSRKTTSPRKRVELNQSSTISSVLQDVTKTVVVKPSDTAKDLAETCTRQFDIFTAKMKKRVEDDVLEEQERGRLMRFSGESPPFKSIQVHTTATIGNNAESM